MKIAYYLDENGGYHGVTDESPVGFSHVVYAGKGPKLGDPANSDTMVEQAYPVEQLKKWELVKPADVPDAWFYAIGYEKREPAPEPAPDPKLRFEIKDGPDRVEGLDEIVRKLAAGYVLAEPEPEPEETKLTILPELSINQLVQDPLFWPLVIMIFVSITIVFKGCP